MITGILVWLVENAVVNETAVADIGKANIMKAEQQSCAPRDTGVMRAETVFIKSVKSGIRSFHQADLYQCWTAMIIFIPLLAKAADTLHLEGTANGQHYINADTAVVKTSQQPVSLFASAHITWMNLVAGFVDTFRERSAKCT
jgi:hypothetical protein